MTIRLNIMDTTTTTTLTALEGLADEMIEGVLACIPEVIAEARAMGLDDLTAIEAVVVSAFELGHSYGHICAASHDAVVEEYDPPGYL